ncbi:MAG: hypothetical protein R2698_01715 [Microthrixaceae bacterium]
MTDSETPADPPVEPTDEDSPNPPVDGEPSEPEAWPNAPSGWWHRFTNRQWFSFAVVAICCGFVFFLVHPELVFHNTTPTGGDMGAHVWGPAYLRDQLLPHLRVAGWSDDWYAGFPAYTFYMVVPSLAIVLLDVGFLRVGTVLGALGSLALLVLAGFALAHISRHRSRIVRFAGYTLVPLATLACIDIPYNVAFKMVAVAGLVAFPAGVWYLLRGLSLGAPGPELGAIVSVVFLVDKDLFSIYGGNIASTMAGEFAFSLSITFALFALGAIAFGLRDGTHRVRAAVLTALAMTCHVIPGVFFLWFGALALVALRPRLASLKWALPVGLSGGLMALFWYLPFYGQSAFLNDMGWEKLGVELAPVNWARTRMANALAQVGASVLPSSCSVERKLVNWHQMRRYLLPLAPHHWFDGTAQTFNDPNMWMGSIVVVLAIVGVVLSLVLAVRAGLWLSIVTSVAAIAFVTMPQDRFWNARVLPFYYLGLYLLAAVGLASVARVLARTLLSVAKDPPTSEVVLGTFTVLVMVVVGGALMMALRIAPGGTVRTDADGKTIFQWGPFESATDNAVRGWAKWNFEGLEEKPGSNRVTVAAGGNVLDRSGRPVAGVDGAPPPTYGATTTVNTFDDTNTREFVSLVKTMDDVGKRYGCGRSMWEYDGATLGKYGTPMAPMLLPYFTDHCIGSMEGLYFEASSTTPFHFLVQSELSTKGSRPERFDCHLGFEQTPYKEFTIDGGIAHLRMLGVRYYMAVTPQAKEAAGGAVKRGELVPLATSGPWEVYRVPDVTLVSPLKNLPAVWTDVSNDIYDWARPAVEWFNESSEWSVLRAEDGPANWPRTTSGRTAPVRPAPDPDLTVSRIRSDPSGEISFHVSKVGSPVLVRASYFPNWRVSGAKAVYRVTPNQMVVVPDAHDVRLTYGRSGFELVGTLLSLVGFAIVLMMLRRPGLDMGVAREMAGDRSIRPWALRRTRDERERVVGPAPDGTADDRSVADTPADDPGTDDPGTDRPR